MRATKHSLIVLVTLLTVAGMAATSLAQARNIWRKPVITDRDSHNPQVCIDNLYQITHCQLMTRPLINHMAERRLMWNSPVYTTSTVPNHQFFALKKSHCRHKKAHNGPTLLRALFPALPDLKLKLERFAVNVEVSSDFNEIGQSTIRLGYRNCW